MAKCARSSSPPRSWSPPPSSAVNLPKQSRARATTLHHLQMDGSTSSPHPVGGGDIKVEKVEKTLALGQKGRKHGRCKSFYKTRLTTCVWYDGGDSEYSLCVVHPVRQALQAPLVAQRHQVRCSSTLYTRSSVYMCQGRRLAEGTGGGRVAVCVRVWGDGGGGGGGGVVSTIICSPLSTSGRKSSLWCTLFLFLSSKDLASTR